MSLRESARRLAMALGYPVLDRLPQPWPVRLKALGSVVFGDWRPCLYWRDVCPLAKALGGVSRAEAERRIQDWDEASRRLVLGYLETYGRQLAALQSLGGLQHLLLVDWRRLRAEPWFLPEAARSGAAPVQQAGALAALRRRYGLRDAGAEVLLCHHGLRELPEEHRKSLSGKDFIDAGAYVGDSAVVLLGYGPRRIYAFEPSPRNGRQFVRTMRRNRVPEGSWELLLQGLGAAPGEAACDAGAGAGTALGREGSCRVAVTTVDAFAEGRGLNVGLIKADVEGMGLELLRGAVGVLRRDRPILSLAMYHNPDEFFGQYEFLRGLDLGYTLRVMDLTPETPGEITLLAWPGAPA